MNEAQTKAGLLAVARQGEDDAQQEFWLMPDGQERDLTVISAVTARSMTVCVNMESKQLDQTE